MGPETSVSSEVCARLPKGLRGPWKAAREAVMIEKGLAASRDTSTASECPLPPLHLPTPATSACLNPHSTEEETEAQ